MARKLPEALRKHKAPNWTPEQAAEMRKRALETRRKKGK
jgi:hypothetical protein